MPRRLEAAAGPPAAAPGVKEMDSDKKASAAGIKRKETMYAGRHFSFVVEDVRLPNGADTRLAVVRHPGSTAIVPLNDDGSVVMVRQYRHAVNAYLLEVPAGTMEPGEPPLDCARRELEEETGLAAARLDPLGRIHILPSYSDEVIYLYLARGFVLSDQNLDCDEIIDVEAHPLDELMEMVADGRITEALTIVALQRTWFYLRQ